MATSRLRDCFINGSLLRVEEITKTYHAVFRDAFYAKDFIPIIADRLHNGNLGTHNGGLGTHNSGLGTHNGGLGTHIDFFEIENYLFENLLPQGFYSPLMVVKIFNQLNKWEMPLLTENQNNILKAEETIWEELYEAHKPSSVKALANSF